MLEAVGTEQNPRWWVDYVAWACPLEFGAELGLLGLPMVSVDAQVAVFDAWRIAG